MYYLISDLCIVACKYICIHVYRTTSILNGLHLSYQFDHQSVMQLICSEDT